MKLAKFYRTQKEFNKIHHRLKQTACPHCKKAETLILHGYLYGYNLSSSDQRSIKGRRVFCSNRNRKQGCGRTFSALKADRIKRFIIQTSSLWSFLKNIAEDMNTFQAFRSLHIPMSTSSIYRLYNTVYLNQHKIRTHLLKLRSTPQNINHKNPLIKTIIHIKVTFKNYTDPIAAFQLRFQISFL